MATPRKSSGEITMGLAVSKEKVQVFTSFYRDGLIEHGKSKVPPPQFPVSTASEASEAVIFVRRRGEKEQEGLVLADCGDGPRHQLQGRSRNTFSPINRALITCAYFISDGLLLTSLLHTGF